MLTMEKAQRDASLANRVAAALGQSAFAAVRRLDCDAEGDCVWIRGQVPTFYTRQVAIELARRVAGVIQVVDEIEVRPPPPALSGVVSFTFKVMLKRIFSVSAVRIKPTLQSTGVSIIDQGRHARLRNGTDAT